MKTKNPLRKRLLRELKRDLKKYLALFILLSLMIGAVSAMYVANDSMETALIEAYDKYNIEDGHFTVKDKPADELIEDFEGAGITTYEQFYKDFDEDTNGDGEPEAVVRVFKNREEINRACLMEGEFPTGENEIVIDRMHADNNGISVGDTIWLGEYRMLVVGLVAFSDYSTLYKNSTDTMFDALTFNIGAVDPSTYDYLDAPEVYQYAYKYNTPPKDDFEKKEFSDDLVKKLGTLAATGGYLDDPDEAEELADQIDEWKDLIDDVKAKGDALTAKKDALEAEAEDLESEGEALKKDAAALMSGQVAVTSMEEMAAKQQELLDRKSALEAKADDLKKRGDELQQEADDLQPEIDEAEAAGDELKKLEPYEDLQNELTDYVPEYINQAIHFAPEDFGSDKAMAEVLLIVIVIVLAFVFAITASNIITGESAVIGTLRASGYRKGELIRHYLTMPIIVTLIAAACGNILGYAVLKNVVVSMYYNSYSLPTYVTVWNADALIRTTLIPVAIMIVVNVAVISLKMQHTPLQFLRHDLSGRKKKRALKLPNIKFMGRFRIRILLQNLGGYLVLLAGISFVCVLLGFAVGLPATLKNYQDHAVDYMLVDYQYVLKDTEDEDGNTIVTDEPTAEAYSVCNLKTVDGPHIGEDITAYGYIDNSRYFHVDEELTGNNIYVTDDFADKFGLHSDMDITLTEEFAANDYVFHIAGIYEMPGNVAILMPNDNFNEIFDKDEGSFTGYLSQNEITDIDEDMIATVITIDDILKMAKQLDHSMGGYMNYFKVICIILGVVIIYLLTKILIERNVVSISMVKVLGYTNKEINSLYIRMTSLVVIVSAFIGSYLCKFALSLMWRAVLNKLNGWFIFYMSPKEILQMVAMVLISYIVVVFFDMRRIRHIPMTEALKNVE